MSGKRKRENYEGEKPACQYGEKCYRKNPIHFQTYSHPEKPEGSQECKRIKVDNSEEGSSVKAFIDDWDWRRKNVPFFLTKVRDIPERFNKHTEAVGLRDILSSKMGDLQASAQFNYCFDIPWLMEHYPADKRSKPLLIVHGYGGRKKTELEEEAKLFPNIQLFQAKLPIPFGTHHSKMMLLLYTEGLRVVITTANLIHEDWDQKTQGVWISRLFPKFIIQDKRAIPALTRFQSDLMEYLQHYGSGPVTEWIECLKKHDMSDAMVHLIASVPGRHSGINKDKWGHLKLRKLLLRRCVFDYVKSSSVIGQFSSIGSLGPKKSNWLCSEWLQSFTTTEKKTTTPTNDEALRLIFPTDENVRTSLEGYSAGGSLPYSLKLGTVQPYLKDFFCHSEKYFNLTENHHSQEGNGIALRLPYDLPVVPYTNEAGGSLPYSLSWKLGAVQPHLKDFFCRWQSDRAGRTRASPHLKCYTRISEDQTKAAWFLLTSANLSKAAWGALTKDESRLMIRSYEIGVLFMPQDYMSHSERYFNLTENHHSQEGNGITLKLPYDLPVVPYTNKDQPWYWDRKYDKPDVHGNRWDP